MSKAYVATGEYVQLVCAYDKNPSKALKKIAKVVDTMMNDNDLTMLSGINIGYDDDGTYSVTAFVSTTKVLL